MQYVNYAIRGDIQRAADESFDCVMCGLCAARCPAQMVQYNIGILARRLYARHIAPPALHLKDRVVEIKDGKYDQELDELMLKDTAELKKLYNNREIE